MTSLILPSHFTPLPARLGRLLELAYNLWWSLAPGRAGAFQPTSTPRSGSWSITTRSSSCAKCARIGWTPAANDPAYVARFDAVLADFDAYMQAEPHLVPRHAS